ncbi:MAG: hypothetical protein IKI64_02185 [Clostridia bacterium]|nr:hypothetical protein [Clostridia bacterium]
MSNNRKTAQKTVAKTAGKPLPWWAIVLGILVVFTIALAIATKGFSHAKPEEDKPIEIFSEPKVRIANSTRPSELIKNYSLEAFAKEADAIAWIRIGNWLGESETIGVSTFAAEVKEQIKGDLGGKGSKITVLQEGTSKATLENYPIFTGGNDLVLFLKRAEEDLQNSAGTVYRIIGDSRAVFYTTLISRNSERFATTLNDEWLTRMPNTVPNIASIDDMWKNVYAGLAVNDKLWNELMPETRLVYSYELLKAAIKSYI